MTSFTAFIYKESQHILRDKRTMLILFGMPLAMMLLFGFAISTDVRHVRAVAVTASADHLTARLLQALDVSEYFDLLHTVPTSAEAEQLIRNQRADIAIVFSPGFADGQGSIQLLIDGAEPNMARQYAEYATQILSRQPVEHLPVNVKLLYNPQARSSFNFVPGIMGMLLMLICAMMTSISIVREKERGTMEVLLVSPVRPLMIIVAKAIPYLVLAFAILAIILLIAKFLLGVPLAGSLSWIIAVSGLYILMALSLGLLISTVAKTQLVALLASAMMLIMPSVLLSGMIFPIEEMPLPLRCLSAIVPPRWYISAMRKLMIMGTDIGSALPEVTVLVVMTVFFLSLALAKFNRRLE